MSLTAGFLLALVVLGLGALAIAGNVVERRFRARGFDRWLPTYVSTSDRRKDVDPDRPVDVFIAICDHYEPETGRVDRSTALDRVNAWVNEYPRLFGDFADASGRPPQHTFFYPQDEYRPEYVDRLRDLVEQGYGEVEIHLHHHDDTPDGFREKLDTFRQVLYHRHDLLRRDPVTGQITYGFIHGNWALCNSRGDGKWCGVDHELPILMETGCYADFTYPSAPSDTQTPTINEIYYAFDQPGRKRSHDRGRRATVGQNPPEDGLLMIQGPLLLDGQRRRLGVLPKVENGDLLASHPPAIERLDLWLKANVTVAGRPDWRFVKLHTHGCKPGNLEMWLGERVQQFHLDLATRHRQFPNFRYHYVTAWEMAQLVHQAEKGVVVVPSLRKQATPETHVVTI